MLMICKYEEIHKGRRLFFIFSLETHCCPYCGGKLNVKDYRKRKWRTIYGKTIIYILRRLRCCQCKKLHTELPAKLLPYRRYEAKAIESTITGKDAACVASLRTKKRWKHWFKNFWKIFVLFFICCVNKNSDKKQRKIIRNIKGSCWLQAVVSRIIYSGEKYPPDMRMQKNTDLLFS